MSSSTELLPVTPLTESAEASWFGLRRYANAQSLPRDPLDPSSAQAQTIPSKDEAKQAAEILKQFADAEQTFWAHHSDKIEREIETYAIQGQNSSAWQSSGIFVIRRSLVRQRAR